MYVVKIACERPDDAGRPLSQWDCTEIARQLVRDGVVASISAATVRQILLHHRLKPWRQKTWLSPKVPRDAAFAAIGAVRRGRFGLEGPAPTPGPQTSRLGSPSLSGRTAMGLEPLPYPEGAGGGASGFLNPGFEVRLRELKSSVG